MSILKGLFTIFFCAEGTLQFDVGGFAVKFDYFHSCSFLDNEESWNLNFIFYAKFKKKMHAKCCIGFGSCVI
jgi:hypothetical protein